MKSVLVTPPPLLSPPPPRFNGFSLSIPQLPSRFRRRSLFPLSSPLTMALSLPPSSQSQTAAAGDIDGSVDAFQLIRAHQDAAVRLSPVEEIRTMLDCSVRGTLTTLSQEHEGYPSGSMVDFACNQNGYPILAVSSLAVHSKNLIGNSKCSLLVAKDPMDRTDMVITLYGDAVSVSDNEREAVRAAYLRKHPDAFWVDFGDFRFIYIKPNLCDMYLELLLLYWVQENLMRKSMMLQKLIQYLIFQILSCLT